MRIGIDLGGTSVAAGIVDSNYNVICRASAKTAGCKTEKELFDIIKGCVYDLLSISRVTLDEIETIGIGCPGSTDAEKGIVQVAGNLPLYNTPVAKILSEEFGKKVFVDNDANCAAWGEFHAGTAKEYENMIMVTIGTGIGGGIILNGKLIPGRENHAGEIGHMVIDIHGKRCACGRMGCWETVASTRALIERVKTEVVQVPYSILGKVVSENNGNVDGRTIFTAIERGCKIAKSIYNDYIELLGIGVMNLIEIFRPDIIVLGGGISREGDKLLDPLNEYIGGTTTLIKTSALDDNAGIIGSALLFLK